MALKKTSDKGEAKVPEETPAPKPAAKPTKTLVKVVADQGVTMSGTHFTHGVKVHYSSNVAWVDEGTAEVLRVHEKNTVTVTDETQVVEA